MFKQLIQESEIDDLINECTNAINEIERLDEVGEQCKAQKQILKNHKERLVQNKKELKVCPKDATSCLSDNSDAIDSAKDSIKATKEKLKQVCMGKKLARGAGKLLKKGLLGAFNKLRGK